MLLSIRRDLHKKSFNELARKNASGSDYPLPLSRWERGGERD